MDVYACNEAQQIRLGTEPLTGLAQVGERFMAATLVESCAGHPAEHLVVRGWP